MPKDSTKKGKKGKQEADEDSPIYTSIYAGVPGRGYVIYGYSSRTDALAQARAHYEREAERIHAALEALDTNRVAVQYTRDGKQVSPSTAYEWMRTRRSRAPSVRQAAPARA